MADVSITAANVVRGTNSKIKQGTLGATVTAGQLVYLDAADNRYKLTDGDSATAAARVVDGIALNGGASGQPVVVHYEGPITIGGTIVKGTVYAMSDVAGAIRPIADNASGDYVTTIGIALTSAILDVKIHNSGVNV